MTKLIVSLVLSSVIVSPVFAQDSSLSITAEVNSICEFSALTGGGIDPSQPIVLTVAGNGKHTGVAQASGATTRAMRLTCNQPFLINLQSEQGAVRRQSAANGGTDVDTPILGGLMAKAIGYTATPSLTNLDTSQFAGDYTALVANKDLQLGIAPADLVSAENVVRTDASGANSGGAYDGKLEIGIATETSGTLISGFYRDTLRVVLVAQ